MSNGYNYADDNDPGVAYAGSWTQITKTGPYANSLHQTTQSGAGATIHFTGNLGRVFGSVPACDPSVHQEFVIVAIFLDDVSVAQVMQPCGTAARDNVMFYDSGTLSGGNQPHKLSAVNQLANCLPFQFSAFSWGVDSATAATATRIVAAPIYSIPPTTGVLSIIAIQGSSGSINRSMRGSSTISSGTSLAADSSPSSSSVQFVTVNGIVTSMVIAPAATGSGDNQGRSLSPSTGLIVGCIMGVLLFVILLILLLNFCRRRRNRLHATTQPSNADAITPFRLTESANNPSTGFPNAKVDRCDESSSSASREAEERRPLPDQERSLPSSESRPNAFRVSLDPLPYQPSSTTSSPPDMAPAYRPRHRSDMSTTAHTARASHLGEAPPSYDNC